MKQKHLLICLIASLNAPFVGASPPAATITVEIIATFDYPGSVSTFAYAINNNNVIAGWADFGGFTRSADGQFSEPLVDMGIAALAYGLNDSGTVCGYFIGSDTYHGFFLSDGTYTTYDVPGHVGTYVNGINNAGDFVGLYDFFTGFTSIGGKVETIDIPGGTDITPHGLNSSNQVVGLYLSNQGYAFYSDTSGQLHYPINAPRGKNTFLYGINDQGWMVGGYADQTGHNRATHGLLFIAPNKFVTVDYAGSASWVVLTGINNRGFICGYYQDSNNTFHGLIARARRTAE
jgi:hypothetical protein